MQIYILIVLQVRAGHVIKLREKLNLREFSSLLITILFFLNKSKFYQHFYQRIQIQQI